jgi:hypothetical protein
VFSQHLIEKLKSNLADLEDEKKMLEERVESQADTIVEIRTESQEKNSVIYF